MAEFRLSEALLGRLADGMGVRPGSAMVAGIQQGQEQVQQRTDNRNAAELLDMKKQEFGMKQKEFQLKEDVYEADQLAEREAQTAVAGMIREAKTPEEKQMINTLFKVGGKEAIVDYIQTLDEGGTMLTPEEIVGRYPKGSQVKRVNGMETVVYKPPEAATKNVSPSLMKHQDGRQIEVDLANEPELYRKYRNQGFISISEHSPEEYMALAKLGGAPRAATVDLSQSDRNELQGRFDSAVYSLGRLNQGLDIALKNPANVGVVGSARRGGKQVLGAIGDLADAAPPWMQGALGLVDVVKNIIGIDPKGDQGFFTEDDLSILGNIENDLAVSVGKARVGESRLTESVIEKAAEDTKAGGWTSSDDMIDRYNDMRIQVTRMIYDIGYRLGLDDDQIEKGMQIDEGYNQIFRYSPETNEMKEVD